MIEVIQETRQVARKDYDCTGCELLGQDTPDAWGMTVSECEAYRVAEKEDFKIRKGTLYVKQVVKNGDLFTFRARPEIFDICLRVEAYDC